MSKLTSEAFEQAEQRGAERMRTPRADAARYDPAKHRIVVRLTTGVEVQFDPQDLEGLHNASSEDLKAVEVENFGLGLHFPTIDADL